MNKMMDVRRFFICFACTFSLLLASCDELPSDAKKTADPIVEEMRTTVLLYNQLLEEGFRKMNMTALKQVATSRQAEKVYHYMSALGEGKGRVESSLKKIGFIEIEVNGRKDGARVRTQEVWDFDLVDFETDKTYESRKDFIYNLTYTLERVNGKWMIAKVVDEDVVRRQAGNNKSDREPDPLGGQEK